LQDLPILHAILEKKWYFDELYQEVFVNNVQRLGSWFRYGFEIRVDRYGPDGLAALFQVLAGRMAALQTGYLFHYALAMICGVVAMIGVGIFVMSGGWH
jgi:NADH-quinone oxidoreductase subunit L